jgi:hypothetical protein
MVSKRIGLPMIACLVSILRLRISEILDCIFSFNDV